MDKGAHFFKCDFQVHTPRDINWKGANAVTEEERKAYAEKLVLACREKGINSLAITDHHDFVFFPYAKKAAEIELSPDGSPIDPVERIVIFPGLELTLATPPCQALLILDSNFPENMLEGVLTALCINASNSKEPKTAEVVPIPQDVVSNFQTLYTRLNGLDYLKDRFIVFPLVSDGGHKTLLRKGFAEYYKLMPCVGGYLDGPIGNLGTGNQTIIAGKSREYGFKPIAIIQTSDNRKETHEDLGKYCTWIKWAEPTAEALRQACLAQDSRISQETPVLPPIFITSIDISNSKFLGQSYLEFNQQYNAIIGGRGTGKSTILEYLRWGLCDQFPDMTQEEEELPRYQERRKKLIEKTLIPYDATVQVSFIKNEIPHIIRRKATGELILKIGTGDFQPCTEENARNLLPIQAYSQKQLSSVGVSIEELKRLIYSPVRQKLTEYDAQFKKTGIDIRACYEKRLQKKMANTDIEKYELELESLTEQVEKLRRELKGISKEDSETIALHEDFEVFQQLLEDWNAELISTGDSIVNLIQEVAAFPTPLPVELKLPDAKKALIKQIFDEVSGIFSTVKSDLGGLRDTLHSKNETLNKFYALADSWHEMKTRHDQQYELAKEKSSSQETTLSQIRKLEERSREVRKSLAGKKQQVAKAGDPETKFETLKQEWISAHRERADLLTSQCAQLERLSDNDLRATLGKGAGIAKLEETLRTILYGSNFRKDKIQAICDLVTASSDSIKTWHEILLEFEELAYFDAKNIQSKAPPQVPMLRAAGLTANDIQKIIDKVDVNNWIDLFLVELDDIPLFEYRTREGEYIDFVDASAGQQATALMHILLNQEGPPLIIDQPEEDLDNKMVSEIADLVCKAKNNRQLIFTSHNANIVVNGDAELVVCCDYKVTGDQSKGGIKTQGAIDIGEIRKEITQVMEGGEKAFKLRKDKYGF
jgi:chromosome segregation protein